MNNMRKLMSLFENDLTSSDMALLDLNLRLRNDAYKRTIQYFSRDLIQNAIYDDNYYLGEPSIMHNTTSQERSKLRTIEDNRLTDPTALSKAGYKNVLNQTIDRYCQEENLRDFDYSAESNSTIHDLLDKLGISRKTFIKDMKSYTGVI